MDAKPRTLKDVFDTQCRYLVPLFQRPYVWKKDEQWEPLWEDVQALAERYHRRDTTHPHFMGAIVLEQLNTSTGTLDLRQLIDGQQRLTTLQILLEAACDVCETLGPIAEDHSHALRLLTRNNQRSKDPDEIYKVWPTNVDREHFRLVMTAGRPADIFVAYKLKPDVAEVGHKIADAYIYFYQKIETWLNPAEGEAELKKRLDALQNAIYKGLIVVVIDLDEKDDSQMIFETLNARGTPLLASDLVKNYLLRWLEAEDHDQVEELYANYWQAIDADDFWRSTVVTGRLKRPRIEAFLQHYLNLLGEEEVLATNLFNTFRDHVKGNPQIGPQTYLKQIKEYGDAYYSFYHFPPDSPEGLFFRRMEQIEITTVYPLVMEVFHKLQAPEYDKQRRAILATLESFLVRRMVCGLPTKNYNKLFLDLHEQLTEVPPMDWNATLQDILLARTSDIDRWPTDDDFQTKWKTLPAYQALKRDRVRLLLEALELQLRANAKVEDKTLPKTRLTIEHLMPQKWQTNWPLPGESQEAKDQREALIDTLGNLTYITGPLNTKLSNNPWSKKRKELKKHSVLRLNVDLPDIEDWDEREIEKRGRALFALAKKAWPRPTTD